MTHIDATRRLLHEFMLKHKRVALMFSAGKDSGACLKLLRGLDCLDRVFVIWANPGRAYPETVEYMLGIRRSVPHFIVAKGDQPNYVREHGYPADTVPFEATHWGHTISRSSGPRLVHITECCGNNMWTPMQYAIRECRATGVIQGQKRVDEWRSPGTNGVMLNDCEYHYPLFNWTVEQVIEYLGEDMPPSYARGLQSSLDCMDCTAYLRHNRGRLNDLRERHPEVYAEIEPTVRWMHLQAMRNLNDLMEVVQ